MKLDVYNHIFPMAFFDYIQDNIVDKGPIKRWLNVPVLYDVDKRLKMMERFGEYQQILSLSAPTIEFLAPPDKSPAVARLANDGMAALCQQHPDRFPSFIASMPMNNPDEAVKEIDRAIGELGACGIQIFSNVNGQPLDDPEFFQIFERMTQLDRPIFLHPARGSNFPDYLTEDKSEFEIWWTFGWPYDTSAAMARIVFSKMFDRLPNLKIITHHAGGMIPFFEGRVGPGWDQLGARTSFTDYSELLKELKKRPLDYFKQFYADTATFGSQKAIEHAIEFFGEDQILFASDAPFDPEGGPYYIRETVNILDNMDISDATRKKIYQDNAEQLLGISL